MKKQIVIFAFLLLTVPCYAEEIVCFNMDSDPGWTAEGQWEFGIPQGGGGPESYDPYSGYTGDNVYGYNLAGNYGNDIPEYKLTTSAIDCKLAENVTLGFYRWLGVESSIYDHAKIQVSNNGTTWTDVWSNGTSDLIDTEWVYCEYDISAVADGQETVYIRWCMGPTDSSNVYAGWNIDDVCLEGDLLDPLFISTTDAFVSTGPEGGPFDPACKSYTLSNEGASDVNWAAEANESWLQITPDSGTLAPDSNVVVNVCISADANLLSEGLYIDTMSFTNTDSGFSYMVDAVFYVGDALVVPLDYPTIQDAINASSNGDTIIVMPGTYTGSGNKNINFNGKAITLKSATGPESCIIDCEGSGRGFYFHSGETSESVVDGFTITDGYPEGYGGGIRCENSSPTINNCIFSENRVLGGGGGMYNSYSNPTLTSCTFTGNRSSDENGGGMYNNYSDPTLTNCTFTGNWSELNVGGGMYNNYSDPTLTNCTFTGNWSDLDDGGGMYNRYSKPNITGCTFSENLVHRSGGGMYNANSNPTLMNCSFISNECYVTYGDDGCGGGMYNTDSNPTLINCRFISNECSTSHGYGHNALGGGMYNTYSDPVLINCEFSNNIVEPGYESDPLGGGIYNSNSKPVLTNCIFRKNYAYNSDYGSGRGGGMYNTGSRPVLTNCTFFNNYADGAGYGIYIYDSPTFTTITNCIFWNNGLTESTQIFIRPYAVYPVINYSCVQGWTGSFGGTGNIGDNPLFVTGPLGDYYLSQVAAGQASESPCVDTGSDTAVNLGLNIYYTTRTDEVCDAGIVDMGYHYPLTICVADIDEDGDVDFADYALFAADFGLDPGIIPRGAVVVDGNLSEWSEGIQWKDLDKVYYGNPNDVNQAQFALRWDPNTNKVYAAVIVDDNDHVFLDEYIHWDASDRLEIYSQGDAAGGSGWACVYDVAQQYMVAPDTSGGSWATWGCGQPLGGDEGLEYVVVVDGNRIIYEIGVTQFDNYGGFTGGDTIVSDLDEGDVVGFDLVADTRSSDDFGMLSENMMTGKSADADQFARYTLVGDLDTPACSEPSSDSDIDGNCEVNLADLAILVDFWLYCYVGSAYNPSPSNDSVGIDPNTVLSWTPGEYAQSHDVYFGIDYNDVIEATLGSNEYMGNFDVNSWDTNNYDPNGLAIGTTYYWRIDEIGTSCSAKGNIWSFSTYAYLNLLSHWKFDEGKGDKAYDSAGSNDGTIYGATWTTGQIDGALDFDGNNDYVDIPDFNLSSNWTISLWTKGNTYSPDVGIGGSMLLGNGSDYDNYFYMCDGKRAQFVNSSGDKVSWTDDTNFYNEWRFAVLVANSSTIELYLDGESQGSRAITPTPTLEFYHIGIGYTYGDDFDGIIDDVRIYDRALDAGEIWQLYLSFLGDEAYKAQIPYPSDGAEGADTDVILSWSPGRDALSHDVYFGTDYNDVNDATVGSNEYMGNQLETSWDTNNFDPNGLEFGTTYYWRIDEVNGLNVWKGDTWSFMTMAEFDPNQNLFSHWKFDEGEGDIAYDSIGSNHGTIYGATWTAGQIDGALDFNGIDDYVGTLNDILSNAQLASGATLTAWFKTGSTDFGCIADIEGYMNLGINHTSAPDSDKLFGMVDGGSHRFFSGSNINNNIWHHAAIVWDGVDTAILYLDGVDVDSGYSDPPTPDSKTRPFTIGATSYLSESGFFNGLIDDVRIYDRELSEEEIWQLYQDGLD